MTAQDFIDFLSSNTQNIGLSTYEQLSSNSTTSAYTFYIYDSLEHVPTDGTVTADYRDFSGGDPGWATHFETMVPSVCLSAEENRLDFRYIVTPESTLGIIYNYDMKSEKKCPPRCTQIFKDYISRFTDNIIVRENLNAANGAQFIKDLEDGIKRYRFVIVYEFSHGNVGSITIGVTKEQIAETLAKGSGLVFMIFDSCHSESMIMHNDIDTQASCLVDTYDPGPESGAPTENIYSNGDWWDNERDPKLPSFKSARRHKEDENQGMGIIDYLEQRFKKGWLKASAGTAESQDPPIVMLWSSTGANTYGWYFKESSTYTAEALANALATQENNRFWNTDHNVGLWPVTREGTKSHWNETPENRSRPCLWTFEKQKGFGKFVYLFCTR